MTVPEPTWPPCDLCGQEESIASIMMLATYETTRFGPGCLPGFLRSVADQVDGAAPAAPPPDGPVSDSAAPQPAGDAELPPCPACGQQVAAGDAQAHIQAHLESGEIVVDAPEQGSARDHWASTTNVRRSTHGHRKPRGAVAGQDDGVPS